jgi:glycosyltransferase involved in cell wall biosynthesis
VKEVVFQFRGLTSKADIYHALCQDNAKTAVFFKKRPLIVTFHDLIFSPSSITRFYIKDEKISLRAQLNYAYMNFCANIAKRSDIIIAPFEITKQDLVNIYKVKPEKIRLINYGVDADFFKPNPEITSYKKQKKIILFIGGGLPAKGCDTLMKAFSIVEKKIKNCELWIIGRFSVFDVPVFAKELKIEGKVKYIGYVPEGELPKYYNLCDIFVFPTKIGFCLQILEAMACGKAIITSDTPDIKEVVDDSALMVSPIDVNKIASCIIDLLSNEEKRKMLEEKARARAILFNWDKVAQKTIEVYLELV